MYGFELHHTAAGLVVVFPDRVRRRDYLSGQLVVEIAAEEDSVAKPELDQDSAAGQREGSGYVAATTLFLVTCSVMAAHAAAPVDAPSADYLVAIGQSLCAATRR